MPRLSLETLSMIAQAYENKTAHNRELGIHRLTSGSYEGFLHHKKEVAEAQYTIVLELEENSKQVIHKRVILPLQEIAKKYSINAKFAGVNDLPSHITLDMRNFQDLETDSRNAVLKWLQSNTSHMQWLCQILVGTSFYLSDLVIGPTSYIAATFCASQITAYRARALVEKIVTRALNSNALESTDQLKKPYTFFDIFHSTVFRLASVADTKNIESFVNEAYATVGNDLDKEPLFIKIAHASVGTSAQYIEHHIPELVM